MAEILYRHDSRQVTIHATIPTAAPGTLAAIIGQCDSMPPALPPAFSDSERTLGGRKSTVIMRGFAVRLGS